MALCSILLVLFFFIESVVYIIKVGLFVIGLNDKS
jgi:hypothetical protein